MADETQPATAGERAAGAAGLLVGLVVVLVAVDLLTGGWLAAFLTAGSARASEPVPCDNC